MRKTIKEARNEMILEYLVFYDNNRSKTAKMLGISPRTLRNYIKEMREDGIIIECGYTSCPHHPDRLTIKTTSTKKLFATNKERLRHADHMLNADF